MSEKKVISFRVFSMFSSHSLSHCAHRSFCVQFMFSFPLAHRSFSHCPSCCSEIYRGAHSYQQNGSFILVVRPVVIAADCKMEPYYVTIQI